MFFSCWRSLPRDCSQLGKFWECFVVAFVYPFDFSLCVS